MSARDEDLRNRFRRDFSREIINRPAPQPPAPKPLRPQPAAPINPLPATTSQAVDAVAEPTPSRTTSPDSQVTNLGKLRLKHLKKIIISFAALAVLAGTGAAYYYSWQAQPAHIVPASIKSAVDFPLLYPTKLPSGYSVSKSSFSVYQGVVIFSASNPNGSKIAFTVQQKPSTFDYDTFYKQGLTNANTFNTNLGVAAIGTTEGRRVGSLATDQSWILVSPVSPKVPETDLRLILSNLQQISDQHQ